MSVKKGFLIALAVSAFILLVGGGRASAQISELIAATGTNGSFLGREIVISALDNRQILPAVAYNSQHDEYLVVWNNYWAGSADIYAQRLTGQGELKSWFAVGPTAPPASLPKRSI